MAITLIRIVDFVYNLFWFVLLAYIILSYVLPPYHNLRMTLSRFIEPLLLPIRQRVKPIGGLDLSPMILLLVLWVLRTVLILLIQSIAF